MFKFSEHPWYTKLAYYLVFVVVLWRHGQTLLAPWLGSDLAFAFRSDNFFSFSGGQIRRGLIGEKLILLQSWGIDAVQFYSVLLLVFFAFAYLIVFPRLLQSFKSTEVFLILMGGFFLMPGLDREIFILLPALYFLFRRQRDLLFYLLIAVLAFVHELALLLYFPFILDLLLRAWKEHKPAQLLAVLLILGGYGAVILIKGQMNFVPEREFWPQYGISGLEDRFLYSFSGKGLWETLKMHLSVMIGRRETIYAMPGMAAFFTIVFLSLQRFGASALLIVYYIGINALIFLLTIDYGRYFYLLFFFYLLISQNGMLGMAEKALKGFKPLFPQFLERLMNFEFRRDVYLSALIVFALAPFGYWLGDTLLEPALWQEVQQLIDFNLPKHAGE